MIIQYLLTVIGLAGLALVWRRSTQGVLRRTEVIGWTTLWMVGVGIVWMPRITDRFAHILGVGRGVDVITYIALALFGVLILQLFISIDRLERRITDMVRHDALRDLPRQDV